MSTNGRAGMCRCRWTAFRILGCEPAFLSMLDLLPNELSRTDKEILYLRYQLNLNCVDIAEYLHISHEASRARLSRAKRHYAHLLAKERLM